MKLNTKLNPALRWTGTFWLAVAGLTLNSIRLYQPSFAATPKVVPYTVILQDSSINSDGTTRPTVKLTIAVRKDGSRVMEMTDLTAAKSQRIVDFASGKKLYVMEEQHRKSTTFDSERNMPAHWLPDPHNSCLLSRTSVEQQVDSEESVAGYRTAKLTSGQTIQWLALDYGCALVKDRADWGDGQVSEKKLIALIPGEPAASLFEEPAGFDEVPPSQMFPGPNASTADSYYHSHRPAEPR